MAAKRATKWSKTIVLNWGFLFAFAAVWSFGWNGSLLRGGYSEILFTPLLFLAIWGVLVFSKRESYHTRFTFTAQDLLAFVSYLAILLLFIGKDFYYPLHGDEALHAYTSGNAFHRYLESHPVHGTLRFVPYLRLMTYFNWTALAGGLAVIALFLLLWKRSKNLAGVFLFIVFVALRLSFKYDEPLPPFRTFPIWLSSTLFFSKYASYRLPSLLAVVSLMWLMQRAAREHLKLPTSLAWLFGLAAGSFPVLIHVGTMVEQSAWTPLIWTCFLIAIATTNDWEKFPWAPWAVILTMGSLMRQPVIAATGVFAVLFVIQFLSSKKTKGWGEKVAPFPLAFLFFFIVLNGRHFRDSQMAAGNSGTALNRIFSGEVFSVMTRDIGWLGLVLILIGLFVVPGRQRMRKTFALWLFFILGLVMYGSVSTFGLGRYQAEYAVPFCILGLFSFAAFFSTHSRRASPLAALLALFAVWNFSLYLTLYPRVQKNDVSFIAREFAEIPNLPFIAKGNWVEPSALKDYSTPPPHPMISVHRVNWKDGFKRARTLPPGSFHDLTSQYVPMNWILEGYSVDQVDLLYDRIFKHYRWKAEPIVVAESVNADKSIDYVFIDDTHPEEDDFSRFRELGWKIDTIFLDMPHQTALYLLRRS